MRITLGQLRRIIREAAFVTGPRRMTKRDVPALGDPESTKWDDTYRERTIDPEDDMQPPVGGTPQPYVGIP